MYLLCMLTPGTVLFGELMGGGCRVGDPSHLVDPYLDGRLHGMRPDIRDGVLTLRSRI